MTAAAVRLANGNRWGAWRLAVTFAVLLAFALQSYVTQTHFHPAAFDRAPVAAAAAAQPAAPAGDEVVACPLCQAIASAGAFLLPPAPPAPRAADWVILASAPPAAVGLVARSAGHAWRSRAPPLS